MSHEFAVKSILHQLGIGKSYKGYDYIVYAIHMLLLDESLLQCVTKSLYIDIARAYHTSSICVERDIRKVIEIIWKHNQENRLLIISIFGLKYSLAKPSNKAFLDLLYEYVKSYNLLNELFHVEKIVCPISKDVCNAYKELVEKITNLK